MKSKLGALLFVLLGVSLASFAVAAAVPQEVSWNPHASVSWDDFLGSPPSAAAAQDEAAAIHMTVRWSTSYTVTYDPATGRWRGSVDPGTVVVTNTMQPYLSWAVPGKESASVLNHEQGHFDLNEAYARRLAAVLPSVRAEGATADEAKAALKAAIDAAAKRILDALQVAQDRYDAQTAHGTDPSEQKQWEVRIGTWLSDPSLVLLSFGGSVDSSRP